MAAPPHPRTPHPAPGGLPVWTRPPPRPASLGPNPRGSSGAASRPPRGLCPWSSAEDRPSLLVSVESGGGQRQGDIMRDATPCARPEPNPNPGPRSNHWAHSSGCRDFLRDPLRLLFHAHFSHDPGRRVYLTKWVLGSGSLPAPPIPFHELIDSAGRCGSVGASTPSGHRPGRGSHPRAGPEEVAVSDSPVPSSETNENICFKVRFCNHVFSILC